MEPRVLEVADDEHDGPAPHDAVDVIQGRRDVRSTARRLEDEQLANDPQDVPRSLAGRHELLHLVGEADEADLVVVLDRRERQRRTDLGDELALELAGGPELLRAAEVHDEQHGELPLLPELLDVRLAVPGRDVPVDRADVIADLIGPHLLELHPAALEGRVVPPGEGVVHQVRGPDLDAADSFEQLLRDHQGTGT